MIGRGSMGRGWELIRRRSCRNQNISSMGLKVSWRVIQENQTFPTLIGLSLSHTPSWMSNSQLKSQTIYSNQRETIVPNALVAKTALQAISTVPTQNTDKESSSILSTTFKRKTATYRQSPSISTCKES